MDIKETMPAIRNRLQHQDNRDKKLREACSDFETMFIESMLKSMRKTVPQDFEGASGNQKQIYQSMFDHELANHISHSRKSMGIGDALYQDLTRNKD